MIRARIFDLSALFFIALGPAISLKAQPATFSRSDVSVGSSQPYSIATGDLNNDGSLDFAVGSTASPFHITTFLNNGSGAFALRATYPANGQVLGMVAADVNHDGKMDLVYVDTITYRVLLGNGDGTFVAGPSHAVGGGSSPQGIAIGDLNGDGIPDIVTSNFGSGDVSIYLGNGDGSFGPELRYTTGAQCYSVITGDVNNDGRLDIIAVNFGANSVSILLGNGNGTFQNAMNVPVGSGPVAAAAADLNIDGKLDLVVANFSNPGSISILLGNGDGTFQANGSYSAQTPSGLAVGDFDGDGIVDLAVARYSASEVSLLRGAGNGTFQSPADLPFGANSWPVGVVSADFNRDGRPDLLTSDFLSGNYSVLLNTTTFPLAFSVSPAIGSGTSQNFSFSFYDPSGAANIISTQMDIGATLTAAGSCYLYFARAGNAIFLADDSGAFHSSLTVGTAGTQQNSQCTLDAGASSVIAFGNVLTLNLALSFKPAFAGQKFTFMLLQDGSQTTNWVRRGAWTVTGSVSSQPDFSLGISPSSQTITPGNSTSYTVTAVPSNGFSGTITLGAASLPAGATAMFNPPTLAGSGSSTMTVSTTGAASTGSFSIQATATSGSLSHSAGATLNIVTGGGPTPPTVVSVSPNSGSGASQTFSFTFSDPAGATNITSTQMDINATLSAPNACYFFYGRAANTIQLANDAGSFGSPLTIGTVGTLQNSQCSVDTAASSVSMAGNTLTVNLAITFKPAFAGAKNTFGEAQNAAGDSGWALLGTWTVTTVSNPQPDFSISMSPASQTVAAGNSTTYTITITPINGFSGTVSLSMEPLPAGASGIFNPTFVVGSGSSTLTINTTSSASLGSFSISARGTSGSLVHDASATLVINSGSSPSPPTLVSVTPNSGSGSSQTFAFTFSDPNGAANITSTQMDINETLVAANACYFFFSRPASSIQLADDAGSFGAPVAIGTATTLQNSQCSLDVGASSAGMSGNTLTVNLAISFKPAFAGAKRIFMEAQNASLDSGWMQLGSFTATVSSVPQPDFSIGVAPPSQTVTAGNSTSYTVTVTPQNGFSGTVNLGVALLPSGASGSFNPPSINGSGSSTLTINTASNTTNGSFSISATGTSGSLSHNAGANLTVNGGSGPTPPNLVSVAPNSGSGSGQTFVFTYSDVNGAANIASTQMDINASLTAANACYFFFSRASSSIQLANDAGSFGAPVTIGTSATLQNSQCILNVGASSAMASGNTLTVSLAITFQAAFAGQKNIFMEAQNNSLDSGWALEGSWLVTTSSGPQPDFSLGIAPPSQSVAAGNSATYTVTVTPINGFTGTVNFSTAPLPAGTTGSFNPPSVAGSGSSTLTISTTNGATLGTYSISAIGTSGALNHSVPASLMIVSGSASPPTPVSVTPNSGSGTSQTFSFVFSDPNGAADITSTQMDINATLVAANACYVFYSRGSNTLQLAGDGGGFGSPITVGTAVTLQNSQCSIDVGASSVMMSGNTLTVNLAVSFKPPFAGAKNVFAEVQNSTFDSGWSQLGTWTAQ